MALLTTQLLYYIVLIIAFGFTSLYLYFKYRFTYWKTFGVAYVEPKFPFGNVEEVIKMKRTVGDFISEHYTHMKSKGHQYFGIYFFHNPALVAIDPDFIKTVLTKDFTYFSGRGIYHDEENDPLTATLFALEGQKWKNLRAKLSPTFTSGKMKKMFQTLVDCSVELKDCLNESIRKSEPVNIKLISSQYTTDVIGSCAFGIECNSFQNSDTAFIRTGKKLRSPSSGHRWKQFLAFNAPWIMKLFKIQITDKEISSFYINLVKETIEYREKNNITRNDFLQLLMQLKNKGTVEYDETDAEHEKENSHDSDFKFTFNSLTAQAFVFFTGGFETTSTAMTFTIFELAHNTTIQDTTREEIVRVLRKHGGKMTYDAMMDMRYLDRVIQEALRKYPALMALQRLVSTDYTIPGTDVVLKKGTGVLIPCYSIQNDPEYYPNPEKFDPDRFTDENKATRPDYTWMPFGDGPRVCIGVRFAMMQMKVGLCQLLLNYKFTLNSKCAYPPVLNPRGCITSPKDTIFVDAERVIT